MIRYDNAIQVKKKKKENADTFFRVLVSQVAHGFFHSIKNSLAIRPQCVPNPLLGRHSRDLAHELAPFELQAAAVPTMGAAGGRLTGAGPGTRRRRVRISHEHILR